MKSFTSFPQNFVKSLSQPDFYKQALAEKSGPALKYFLIFTFLISVARAAVVSMTVVPVIERFINKLSQNIVDFFPADLTLTITNGQVSTQSNSPYIIPISALDNLLPQAKSDLNDTNLPSVDNLAVVDTKATSDDYQKYKTMILVTKSGFVIPDSEGSGGFRYYPLPKDTNATVDRRFIRSLWSEFAPILKWVIPTTIAVIWLGMILWYPSWYLTYLLFGSLVVWLMLKITKKQIPYRSTYKIGLYSLTWPILIDTVLSILNIHAIPFLFTFIFVLFTLLILKTPTPKS